MIHYLQHAQISIQYLVKYLCQLNKELNFQVGQKPVHIILMPPIDMPYDALKRSLIKNIVWENSENNPTTAAGKP